MSLPHRTALTGCFAAALLVTGCGDPPTDDARPSADPDTTTTAPGTSSGPDTAPAMEPQEIGPVAMQPLEVDLREPLDAHPLGESLLVAERAGVVEELVANESGGYDVAGVVVDLTEAVGDTSAEKGLLGLTTDPGGEHLYVNHTRADDGATVVAEYTLEGGTGSLRAGRMQELVVIDQPFANHNGGDLAWGPDRMLWVGTGDGGSGGDPDGRAQRLDMLLGKILRIDPSVPGLVPTDNPYADGTGPGGTAEPFIWARGVRNPWRISFDSETGDLWVADVGQNRVEEIDVLRTADDTGRGADLGWDVFEGDERFGDPGPTDGWPDDDAPLVEPVHTYTHDETGGCSVTGGFVYRGTALPGLQGWYLFSDFCDGRLRALAPDGEVVDLGVAGDGVVSINPDEDGEPLVLDADGITRLVPA